MEWRSEFGNPDFSVIIFGYATCPYTAKALQLATKHTQSIRVERFHPSHSNPIFRSADEFRKRTNYNGTFPVIFTMQPVYIGGANELERLLS